MPEIYDYIVQKYYDNILNYCNMKLNHDIKAAEDCTQEVFLILAEKIDKLNLSISIQNWLYCIAKRRIKAYIHKHPPTVDIEELHEMPDYSSELDKDSILDELTDDEKTLLKLYYGGEDKMKIASAYGITLSALHSRIRNIRKKLKNNCENSTNTE